MKSSQTAMLIMLASSAVAIPDSGRQVGGFYDPADIGWSPRRRKSKAGDVVICGARRNKRKLLKNC